MFDSIVFFRCTFPETKLSNLDFSGVSFRECNFAGSVIENSIFQQFKDANKIIRKKFNLTSCKFENTNLTGSIFALCILDDINFKNSKLNNCVFEKCNLTQASLSTAEVVGVNFEGSKIDRTALDINGFINFGNSKGFILGD